MIHNQGTRLRERLLAAALEHARRDWHVFPLRPSSKQPALHGEDHCPRTGPCRSGHQGWEQRATTDPSRIHACWTHGPCFNIGVACGPSGLVVLDLDVPKPGQTPPPRWAKPGITDGADVLADLCGTHGQPWPSETFTARTGRGGTHLYFTAPRRRGAAQHRRAAGLVRRHPRTRRVRRRRTQPHRHRVLHRRQQRAPYGPAGLAHRPALPTRCPSTHRPGQPAIRTRP